MCDTYVWEKAKHIHKGQTHFHVIEDVHKDYNRKDSFEKKIVVVSGLGAKTDWLVVNRQP
jgi:hypothetical protein